MSLWIPLDLALVIETAGRAARMTPNSLWRSLTDTLPELMAMVQKVLMLVSFSSGNYTDIALVSHL